MVGGNAIVARQRELESAAEAGTVDGGNDRLVGGLDPAYRLLSLEAQPLSRVLTGEGGELLDICTGDEAVGLSRDQNDRAGADIIAEPNQQGLDLDPDCRGELVDRLAGQVEGDDGDAVFVLGSEGGHGCQSSVLSPRS